MANLTKDWIRFQAGDLPVKRSAGPIPVKANTKILGGALVGVEVAVGTGWGRPATGSNVTVTAGVNPVLVDNTGGANGDQFVNPVRGVFPFHNDTVSPVKPENVMSVCYVLDDNTVTMNNTGQTAGKVLGFAPDGLPLVEVL